VTVVVLVSPLPRAQCVARLNDEVGSRWAAFGSHEALGRVREDSMWLKKNIRYRNSWQTAMRARIDDEGTGTRIVCKFGMARVILAFTVFWFSVPITMALVSIFAWVESPRDLHWQALLSVMAMPLLGAALVTFCRWLARDEKAFLTEFVCRAAGAHVVGTPVPP
jgi:hypothetical protein